MPATVSTAKAFAAGFGDDGDDDDDYIYTPDSSYSSKDNPASGGTQKRKSAKGRKLMRWSPAEDQYLLLCIENYVASANIAFDWNNVGELIGPTVTGEAIKQHLAKLRKQREAVGLHVPPKVNKIGGLIAPSRTPRHRGQASGGGEDPFLDKTPAPKSTGTHLIHAPTKNSGGRVQAEGGDRRPASKKRKAPADEPTPTPAPRLRTSNPKKERVPRGGNFEKGTETNDVLEQFEMGNVFSRKAKPPPAKNVGSTRRGTRKPVSYAEGDDADEFNARVTNTINDIPRRGPPSFNHVQVDGAVDEEFEVEQANPPTTAATNARSPSFAMHGLPIPATGGMDLSFGGNGFINFGANKEFGGNAWAAATFQNHLTPASMTSSSQPASGGMVSALGGDGMGYGTGVFDPGNAIFDAQEMTYGYANDDPNWLTGKSADQDGRRNDSFMADSIDLQKMGGDLEGAEAESEDWGFGSDGTVAEPGFFDDGWVDFNEKPEGDFDSLF